MCEIRPVEVNQRDLVDKVLARYPEEFTVFRELLQNADDAGAENFTIVFQASHRYASNGTKPDLSSVKVCKWLVRNDGAPFQDPDWGRLTKIAEGNPDERKIGAFGVGFFSVFSVTDKPIVKSNGKMVSIYYEGDKLYVKKEEIIRDSNNCTVIEMELKQTSTIPRIFELTRFLVTSMTFLARIQCITISLDDTELSRLTKTRNKGQSIVIPEHMVRRSPGDTMTVASVKLICWYLSRLSKSTQL
ncbi:histidine kinase-like ATPase [Suillus paluster]|uniref:histidine kinase-like ATPase n=1 Tax=Suillus paluster TaxID=48578 RepID=UPI001B87E9CA|nr:histidine kinase-like ATPase [Suillus paluster]KAG1730663.1 histidine kinase-like ATPase [Suillus paluster]